MARLIQVESGTTGTNITTTPGTSSTRSQVLYICDYTRELDPDQVGSIEFCRIRNLLPTYSFNIKSEIRFKNIKCLVARTRVEKEK